MPLIPVDQANNVAVKPGQIGKLANRPAAGGTRFPNPVSELQP